MTDRNLFICRKDCKAKADERKVKQAVFIEKGEIVQFRFDSPKNFRTINEEYFKVEEDVWKECFVEIGTVWDQIIFNNKATMQEILSLNLYNKSKEQETAQKLVETELK